MLLGCWLKLFICNVLYFVLQASFLQCQFSFSCRYVAQYLVIPEAHVEWKDITVREFRVYLGPRFLSTRHMRDSRPPDVISYRYTDDVARQVRRSQVGAAFRRQRSRSSC